MQFLVYILVYPFLWLISKLPFTLFYLLSDIIYVFVYRIFGYRKRVVRSNLALVFPKKSKVELQRIEKNFYKHMCDMFLEMIKTMNLSKQEVKKRYQVTNLEVLQDIAKDQSVLVVCSHYANWEWNVSINNYVDAKGYAVYQKIANAYFDRCNLWNSKRSVSHGFQSKVLGQFYGHKSSYFYWCRNYGQKVRFSRSVFKSYQSKKGVL